MFASLIMVPFLRKWALEKDIVDRPGGRKKHLNVTPRLGGIAIGMSFLFAMLVFVDMTKEIRGILAGLMVIFFTGLVDDLVGISAKRKFAGEIVGALVAIIVGDLYLSDMGNLFGYGKVILPAWLAIPFTVFAVVGVVNALNLIDGLDGLSGGVSVIALAAFFLLAFHDVNLPVMVMSAGLLGALLGFLKYNFFPARIFMGDAGSLIVGFMLAVIAIHLTQQQGSTVSPIAPLIILGIPIIDTIRVMGKRMVRGQSPFSADRTHIHHRFLDLGFEHRITVIVIYGLSLFWGTVAILFHEWEGYVLFVSYLALSAIFYLGLRFLRANKKKFVLLTRDSSTGLRESALYRRASEAVAGATPLASASMLVFFSTAVFVSMSGQVLPTAFTVILFAAIMGMILFTHDMMNPYAQALLYSTGFVGTFVIRGHAGNDLFGVITVGQFTDLLLVGVALFVVLRILFRRPNDFFFNHIDYLFLGICIFLAVVAPRIREILPISGTLGRGVVIFMGLKAVGTRGRGLSWGIAFTLMAMLLVIVLKGI
jgi:UDP-GlcNAc:undecaprenyl-phosphate GlcNAc-1-phosphate transferase